MNGRTTVGYALWSTVIAAGCAASFAAGVRSGSADDYRALAFAQRIDRDNACLSTALRGNRTSTARTAGYPSLGYERVVETFSEEQDCLKMQSLPFVSAGDIYQIAGVAFDPEFPSPADPIWKHPQSPRRRCCHGSGVRDTRAADTESFWVRPR